MRPLEEVYPEYANQEKAGELYYGPSDYGPLLDSLGYEIILKVDDDDYQGDSRLLLKNHGRYGILIFGWGSCSGCDSLQACGSIKDIENLRNKLNSEIIWKNSSKEMCKFIENRDWELQFSYHSEETKHFINQAITLLNLIGN